MLFAIDLIRDSILEPLLFSNWLAARLFSNYVVRWHTCKAGNSRVCQHFFRLLAEERGTKITPGHFFGRLIIEPSNNPLGKKKKMTAALYPPTKFSLHSFWSPCQPSVTC